MLHSAFWSSYFRRSQEGCAISKHKQEIICIFWVYCPKENLKKKKAHFLSECPSHCHLWLLFWEKMQCGGKQHRPPRFGSEELCDLELVTKAPCASISSIWNGNNLYLLHRVIMNFKVISLEKCLEQCWKYKKNSISDCYCKC